MTAREIVVVDVETSALRPNRRMGLFEVPVGPYGVITEIAWWNLNTDERACFVPNHDVGMVRRFGEAPALVVSRYLERLVEAKQDNGVEWARLHAQLDGRTLAGSNPSFDAGFLSAQFATTPKFSATPDPWHHRLLDLSAYAAGVLGVTPAELPGLSTVCDLLDIPAGDHTAEADVTATGLAFKALMAKAGVTPSTEGAAA